MQKLVILLRSHDLARPDWAVVNDDGSVQDVVVNGDMAELAAIAQDRMTIVIVPAEDVLLTSVTLPKMNRARFLQAIPYALEEQIIEDVETMHFAAGEYRANGDTPVVVVARDKMTEWMTLLQSHGIKPDHMMPAIFALPVTDGVWTAMVNDVAVVRTGENGGFACDQVNLAEMLTLALSSCATVPQKLDVLTLHANLNLSLSLNVKERKLEPHEMMTILAQQAVNPPPVNLLQGDFQNKKARGLPQMTSLIRIAVYLGVAWLFLLFLYPVVSFIILDQRAKDIKTQIALIYKREFPNSASVVAPKERMQQKINKLSSGVSDNQLLMLMANIGKGLSQATGVTLKRMDYQNNMMMLEISAASSDVFSNFTDALSQQGLKVKQQNAVLNGARVNATLEIE